jgi:hypothetical protein
MLDWGIQQELVSEQLFKTGAMLYVVKYSGPFGFIKPWTAVRDSETFSQQFLTPSILGGIERKLFPELLNEDFGIFKIKRYRLTYQQISQQQEQTQPRGWNLKGTVKNDNSQDAEKARKQHICLARNEDLLYPVDDIIEVSEKEFDTNEELFYGFELIFEKNEQSFLVGYNRMNQNKPMYGWLKIIGNPVKNEFK